MHPCMVAILWLLWWEHSSFALMAAFKGTTQNIFQRIICGLNSVEDPLWDSWSENKWQGGKTGDLWVRTVFLFLWCTLHLTLGAFLSTSHVCLTVNPRGEVFYLYLQIRKLRPREAGTVPLAQDVYVAVTAFKAKARAWALSSPFVVSQGI